MDVVCWLASTDYGDHGAAVKGYSFSRLSAFFMAATSAAQSCVTCGQHLISSQALADMHETRMTKYMPNTHVLELAPRSSDRLEQL